MTPVRLEPAAPLSRGKHSTTEPLRSHISGCGSAISPAQEGKSGSINLVNMKILTTYTLTSHLLTVKVHITKSCMLLSFAEIFLKPL